MPVYEYKCQKHEIFYDLATLDNSANPCPCPICGEMSPRIIVLAPSLLDMSPDKRNAHAVNERNQHEPTYSTQDRRELDTEHAKGCGCAKPLSKSKLMYTAQGNKVFPSMRPWMISH